MRTTITLTPEADALVRRLMRERGISFKTAVNEAIVGMLASGTHAYTTPVRSMGRARVSLDRALSIAAELEDEAIMAKRELGK